MRNKTNSMGGDYVRPGRPAYIADPKSLFDGVEGVVMTEPNPETGTVTVKIRGVPLAFAGSTIRAIYQRPAS